MNKKTSEEWIEHGDYKEIHPIGDDDGLIIIADIDPENQMTDKQRRSIGKKLINGLNYMEDKEEPNDH